MSRSELSRRGLLAGASGLLLGGCGARLGAFPFDLDRQLESGLGLSLHFYSVSCMRLGFGGIELLVDPFFTHLPFRRAALGRVVPEQPQVQPYLEELARVRAVLVGHAHYDHALDLPAVDQALHPDARVLGSPTLAHTFAPCGPDRPIVALEDLATQQHRGDWWTHPSAPLRVLPILSGHPNQWAFVHLYRHSLSEDRDSCPSRAWHYQEGVTMAFLVDFLDELDRIERRVFVQTSSTGLPAGLCPQLSERPVDLALLPMDCANAAMKGPSILDHMEPRVVAFNHWGDFFRSKDQEPREGVKVQLPDTLQFSQDSPTTTFLFPGWDSSHQI